MSESIFSYSSVMLFGIELEDVAILDRGSTWRVRAFIDSWTGDLEGIPTISGVDLNLNDFILLVEIIKASPKKNRDGIYRIKKDNWVKVDVEVDDAITIVNNDTSLNQKYGKWIYRGSDKFDFARDRRRGARRRRGENRQFEEQLGPDARFARIYGYSFDGVYYDLPRPTILLVHGNGQLVTEPSEDKSLKEVVNRARAPRYPELTGLAAAGFDFGDDVRVWFYDKSDYTVRMDVETGMLEDVLLEPMSGGPGGMDAAGMSARGMSARGMSARGMSARGMSARGMSARGGNNSD